MAPHVSAVFTNRRPTKGTAAETGTFATPRPPARTEKGGRYEQCLRPLCGQPPRPLQRLEDPHLAFFVVQVVGAHPLGHLYVRDHLERIEEAESTEAFDLGPFADRRCARDVAVMLPGTSAHGCTSPRCNSGLSATNVHRSADKAARNRTSMDTLEHVKSETLTVVGRLYARCPRAALLTRPPAHVGVRECSKSDSGACQRSFRGAARSCPQGRVRHQGLRVPLRRFERSTLQALHLTAPAALGVTCDDCQTSWGRTANPMAGKRREIRSNVDGKPRLKSRCESHIGAQRSRS